MSVEHDTLSVDPRLDTLLRQIVAGGDLQPDQRDRVRARLGLAHHQMSDGPTMTLPASPPEPIRAPEQEGIQLIATTSGSLRQQWLQFVLAAVAFIVVGGMLTLLFESRDDGDAPVSGAGAHEQFELIVPWSPPGIVGNEKLYVVPLDGSDPRRLIPSTSDDGFREWAPDVAMDGSVVFASDRDGQPDLYIWDGSQLRQVTNTDWTEYEPRWSPDGTRITYTGPSTDRDVAQVWVVDADGQMPEQLTDRQGGAVSPAWSPDGSRIAFTSIGAQESTENGWTATVQLWIMNADGSDEQQITRIDQPGVATFSWLDDRRLVITGTIAAIVTSDGEVVRELAPDRRQYGDAPASPSGSEAALVSSSDEDGSDMSALLIAAMDGTSVREVVRHAETLWGVTWSPDGEWLAYTRGVWPSFNQGPPPDPLPDWTLAVIDRDGGDERILLDGVNRAYRIAWRRVTAETTVAPDQIVREALAPLPPEQERRIVLDVEAHTEHDNAFNRWTVELWQRWSADGIRDEGLYVSDPTGEMTTHIVLDGQQPLMDWEPRDGTFDTPLEYSLQGRVLGSTLAAVNDPESYNLITEERDGQLVIHFEWIDDQAREFNYVNMGEAWIDPESRRLLRVVHLVDRPEAEPSPTRTFVFREIEILPTGSSPEGTYTISGTVVAPTAPIATARATPDEMGMYRGITLEQAQEIVPFELVMPERVPNGLEPPNITVIDFGPLATGGRRYHVQAFFEVSGSESPGKSVEFLQRTPPSDGPNMPDAETTTTTINGVEVNRTTGVNAGGEPLLAYWWTNNDISYLIMSNPEGDLTPGLVEDLMLAILVPSGPTVEEQSAILEAERSEMMSVPVPDSCTVSSWAGPDFRVRRSGAAAYFLDGDGLTLGTTHGVLFAGENEITWLADAPLTTEEALSGPRTIVAGRDDTVGDPVPVEIPVEATQQIERRILPDDAERGWSSTVNLPDIGCWEIQASLGQHSLMATVYVFPPPDQSGITFDETRVEEIALTDPRVQAVLAGHPHQVSQVGMWTRDPGRLIGGIVAISVNGDRNIEGEWFGHSFLDCETRPVPDPVVVSYRAEFSGVTEIHVLVDLSREAVVVIEPFWDESVSLVGDREFTGEYNEIRQCDIHMD